MSLDRFATIINGAGKENFLYFSVRTNLRLTTTGWLVVFLEVPLSDKISRIERMSNKKNLSKEIEG